MFINLKRSLIVIVLLFMPMFVQAALLISPTHVEFGKRDRVKELVLINTGNKVTTYRILWTQKKALAQGGYEDLTPVQAENFPIASGMLRFSPKQVSLRPGERQVIKLALRKPKGLKDGEYRSHLMLKALPSKDELKSDGNSMSMKLKLFLSYSLPVVVRVGDVSQQVGITGQTFTFDPNHNKGHINVRFSHQGIYSSLGKVMAYWTPSNGGEKQLIAQLNGYSIYPELDHTIAKLAWTGKPFTPADGKLTIIYQGSGSFIGKVFAKQTFSVSKNMIKVM